MNSPFKKVWKKINAGDNQEKMWNKPEFPHIVDVELTNRCNLRCKMCPTGTGEHTRRCGFMGYPTFSKLVMECAKHQTPIRLVRWGEPMLHPDCFRFIRFAKSQGLAVHMNTNGTLMDDEVVREILLSRLDSIKFSFQGVDSEGYEQWRQGGNFVSLCGWIKHLYVQRNRTRGRHPHIQVGTTVTSETDLAIDAFRKSMEKVSDLVTIGKTEEIIRPQERTNPTAPTCPEVFGRLSVNWDGTVTACCRDFNNLMMLGSLRSETLTEMWNGAQLQHIRKCLLNNTHSTLPLCGKCFL